MRRCVIIVVSVSGDTVQVLGVGLFAAICEEPKVLEDVVLRVRSYP